MDYKFCVFIGRFQPFHQAHKQVVEQALKEAEQVIIVIGSARCARNIKNPWTFDERVAMVKACFKPEDVKRLHFMPARDYYYSDNIWVTQIQQAVNSITKGETSVALIGSYKDGSSYYIKYFPQWDFIPAKTDKSMNATDVRKGLFESKETNILSKDVNLDQNNYWRSEISDGALNWMYATKYFDSEQYATMKEEYAFIESYKAKWANVPFPVTFNTVDAVVIQSGHVLVVRRKFNPGKGLIALPGGFIKQSETLAAAAIRELKEETGIKVNNAILHGSIVDKKVFDHPGRSLRGRTITHAFCLRLPAGELPEVKASDDAEQAFWLPLMDVSRLEPEFYEDHAHIIEAFIHKF